MSNCCVETVPHHASGYETFARSVADWQARLTAGLTRSIQASDETLGHMEEAILKQTQGLERKLLQITAQQKADQSPPNCPVCGCALSRRTRDHERTFHSRFGPVTVKRLRGWCRRCRAWRFPADSALGLSETGGASPSVQEMAALTVSKMPVNEASAVIERLTGVKLPPATLDREARRQGQQASRKRKQQDEQMCAGQGAKQMVPLPPQPFTLVIELDAWNIRERDQWGQSHRCRAAGREPERWHWVYGGTCFRLDQREPTAGGRSRILSRGTVMTREGVDGLREQLFAEARRQGLAQAAKVLVVADGALWIWNLAGDRFGGAHQRLDYFHASQHLWAVAQALHPENETAARAWVEPLLKKLQRGRAASVLTDLRTVAKRLRARKRQAVESELRYLESHAQRMDYGTGSRAGEPLGSGAMESTCRQFQCRFKRPGQFWSRLGDEGLMCLETFWRNNRWHLLYPHILQGDPNKN
ncbi:MAG: ISKra4 family transposase [Verrucomicrobiota bacterium]